MRNLCLPGVSHLPERVARSWFSDTRRAPTTAINPIRAVHFGTVAVRHFAVSTQNFADGYAETAEALHQKGLVEQESDIQDHFKQAHEKQVKTPWHREGSSVPPVNQLQSAGPMTKGKKKTSHISEHCARRSIGAFSTQVEFPEED